MQRAHRIGQTRAVKAVRFITSGTVEDKARSLPSHLLSATVSAGVQWITIESKSYSKSSRRDFRLILGYIGSIPSGAKIEASPGDSRLTCESLLFTKRNSGLNKRTQCIFDKVCKGT